MIAARQGGGREPDGDTPRLVSFYRPLPWLVAVIVLAGCGWFTSSQAATATAIAIDRVAEIVRKQTGRDLDDVPVECDVESNPEAGEVLMLCTVKLRDVAKAVGDR